MMFTATVEAVSEWDAKIIAERRAKENGYAVLTYDEVIAVDPEHPGRIRRWVVRLAVKPR